MAFLCVYPTTLLLSCFNSLNLNYWTWINNHKDIGNAYNTALVAYIFFSYIKKRKLYS